MSIRSTTALMNGKTPHYRAAICCTAFLAIVGCTTTTTQSFKVADAPNIAAAFIAADADFSKYYQLLAEDMGIFFPQNTRLTDQELQRLRQIFREAFLTQLTDYKIVEEPGPGTLAVQASLIDLRKAAYVDMPNLRTEIRDVARPGELLFLMELRDSETKRVLGRAADSAAIPSFASEDGTTTDWAGVEAAAENWASLFRGFLDKNLGR